MKPTGRPSPRGGAGGCRAAWSSAASAVIGAALAATLLGCASAQAPVGGGHQPPSAASSPASDTARQAAAGTVPAIGTPYRFDLYIHCGAPIVSFAGRSWKPVPPVASYPGPREVNGTYTYTGYVAGTMTLMSAVSLRFTADPGAVAAPFSVLYEPTSTRTTSPVCS